MRSSLPEISPIRYNGIELQAIPADGNGAIIAKDAKSGKILWEKKIYSYPINDDLEPDVQWVFVQNMHLEGNSLIITNEIGDRYSLDLKSLSVRSIKQPKWHSDISLLRRSFDFDSDGDWVKTSSLIKKCSEYLSKTENRSLSFSLFDDILNWKLRDQRYRTEHHRNSITENMVSHITACCFSFHHSNPEIEVITRLRILKALPGVGLGVASAILTLCFPDNYAIIDYRVWKVLYGEDKKTFTEGDYLKYYYDIWTCSRKLQWKMQEVDFFVWKYWERKK